jgi:hypothetical protein
MTLIVLRVSSEHVQAIRSNIELESVEKCRDVQNEPIWADFRKKAMGTALSPFFKHRYILLKLKTAFSRYFYKYSILKILESI